MGRLFPTSNVVMKSFSVLAGGKRRVSLGSENCREKSIKTKVGVAPQHILQSNEASQ
jgi:hypothetical protein